MITLKWIAESPNSLKRTNGSKSGITIPDFEPFVRFNEFGDSAIHFNVIMRVREYSDRYELIHLFIKRLHERFRAEGIEIPYPVQQIIEKGPTSRDGDGSWLERTGGAQARN